MVNWSTREILPKLFKRCYKLSLGRDITVFQGRLRFSNKETGTWKPQIPCRANTTSCHNPEVPGRRTIYFKF